MEKKRLIDEKEELFKQILRDRDELKDINEMINEIGGSVSFIKFFVGPLIVAVVVAVILKRLGLEQGQKVGGILITFIVAFVVATIINRKEVNDRKDELISRRIEIQRQLAAKGKRLAEIEEELKN